jgi:hypothetical protein
MCKDSFAILIDSVAFKDSPNKIFIYDRTTNQVCREILNLNRNSSEFLGLRIFPSIKENPLLLVRDLKHVLVVDVTTGTQVILLSSHLDIDIINAGYLEVREEHGIYEIFTIQHVNG